MPSEREMARVILADQTGQAFEAYYGGIRRASKVEPTRELARKVLQNVADGHYFDDPSIGAESERTTCPKCLGDGEEPDPMPGDIDFRCGECDGAGTVPRRGAQSEPTQRQEQER